VLTIAYCTARREPCLDWFLDSLRHQAGEQWPSLRVVVVDFHAAQRPPSTPEYLRVPPKPTVWQGPGRKTRHDYFCGSNARNTAACYAPDGWIAYVDDLSVLMPGWLDAVGRAMRAGYVVGGAYRKVRQLVVGDGTVLYYDERDESGWDTRYKRGPQDDLVDMDGGQLYGCSMALPLAALEAVNGFDEDCDCVGLGSEDYTLGLMLQAHGYPLRYDRTMLTLESEERHGWEPPLLRVIEHLPPRPDASWELLNAVRAGRRRAPNPALGPGGLAALRQSILAGEPFPAVDVPTHNWYSGLLVASY